MSTVWQQNEERLEQLLADRALFGLERDELAELRQRLALAPDHDTDSLDFVAASVLLAYGDLDLQPMPNGLRRSIRERGMHFCAGASGRLGGNDV